MSGFLVLSIYRFQNQQFIETNVFSFQVAKDNDLVVAKECEGIALKYLMLMFKKKGKKKAAPFVVQYNDTRKVLTI
ncbi:hypothetical protein [Alkalihalobacterium alkalinitrilicum]|uniref:hypothetical protein n=1 Tax=Alkalihalobacterium alkalinitrilicum TaxID=427920 RepID=UPI00099521A6|nr:hypothetical protein [Alkalihalobacterium alkalinitrilicum]